jgi:glycosyltransferase involved in cell wall biosynthesis/Flp pilus assembly protein TadD
MSVESGERDDAATDARVALERGEIENALGFAQAALKKNPPAREAFLVFAELAIRGKNFGLAQKLLTDLSRKNPHDPRVRNLLRRVAGLQQIALHGSVGAEAARSKHVLLFTDDPGVGGVAQYNHALLLALVREGHWVTCVQTQSDTPLVREQREQGVRHRWLDHDTSREFARTLTDNARAKTIFESDRPELIVFSDCCPFSNMAARDAAMRLGIPFIVVVGFVGAYLARDFPSALDMLLPQHGWAKRVVAVSGENLRLLHDRFGTPPSLSEVIHYGRPAKFFAPRNSAIRARLRAELKLPEDAVVCFTAARLTAVKGFNFQLAAMKVLRSDPAAKTIHMVWAGDGDQLETIARDIAQLGLGDRIHLLGHRWDVAEWFDAADIFILPSLVEGMPLAIMEAMAKSLPVIATAISGIPEELGDTGKLLPDPQIDPQGVVRELAQTLRAWAHDAELRHKHGAKGRERAVQMFREETMIANTLGLIKRVLTEPAATGLASHDGPWRGAATPAAQAFQAKFLLSRGDEVRALAAARTALAADPNLVDALVTLGELALKQDGGGELAEQMFRRVGELASNEPEVTAGLAEALIAQKKFDDADRLLKAALKRTLAAPRLLTALARLRETAGDRDAAIQILENAVRLNPSNPALAQRLGEGCQRAGRSIEALTAFRRAFGCQEPVEVVTPGTRPVRVAFLVQYPQGWTSLRSVWDAFASDPEYSTTVIACPNKPPHQVEGGSDAIYDFLTERGIPFVRWTEFEFRPRFADVLFIQLPYDITRATPLHAPELLKLVPRLAYVPYALEIGGGAENINLLTNLPLHQFAWAVFARSIRHKANFARYCATGDAHVIATGHPKMDALRSPVQPSAELRTFLRGRKAVLWNPHYDVKPNGSPFGGGFSTFLRWRQFLPQEFSRRQDVALVMRPHPLFFDTLVQRQILTKAEIDQFLAACAAAGNIWIDREASYLPVFTASDAMISDASSFILEYAGTGKPLLYLHNPHGPGLNSDGEFVRDFCRTAQEENEIRSFLDDVAAGRDEIGAARRAAFAEFMQPAPEGVGQAIKAAVRRKLTDEANDVKAAQASCRLKTA